MIHSRAFRQQIWLAAAVTLSMLAISGPARAWWRGGFVVGVAPVPLYLTPPVVYAPPPVFAPPAPPTASVPAGQGYHCSAGFYQCYLPGLQPIGSTCTCPGLGAPSYGAVD